MDHEGLKRRNKGKGNRKKVSVSTVLFPFPFSLFPFFPVFFTWTILILWASVCGAQTSSDADTSLWYRRWLAPVERFNHWPFGEGNYLPFNRSIFEEWVDQLENFTESPDRDMLVRVVLQARLEGRQLVDGRGFFDFRDDLPLREIGNSEEAEDRHFPLAPLGVWISSPKLDDGTEAAISQMSTGEFCLTVPEAEFRQAKTKRIRFQWSLRGTIDAQGPLLFDFQLPRCLSLEVQLDLPPSMVPSSSVGIILEDEKAQTANTRRWRILLGGNSKATVALSLDERLGTMRKTAVRQWILYSLSPQGMKTTNRVYFDKADPLVNELQLELDAPLQPIGVRYGGRAVPWLIASSDDGVGCRLLVNLAAVEKTDQRELSIIAQSPFTTDRLWELPRVRILSSNVFWKETHVDIAVQRPLVTNRLVATRATQVLPKIQATDPTEQDAFGFQYFDPDSQLAVEVDYFSSEVAIEDATQIFWGNSEIKGDMTLDASLNEGDLYTLDFPVADRWTIYSVKSLSGDDVRSWDILDAKEVSGTPTSAKNKILTILLKHPLRPKEGIRLQISGRYYPPTSQQEFLLAELIPLVRERKKGERHFIALNSDSPYQFKYVSPAGTAPEIRNPLDSRFRDRFSEPPLGTIFPLDTQTQDIRFSLEPLKPSYSVEIAETILLKENEMISRFRFLCHPTDSTVDRLYVHFTPAPPESWRWETSDESSNPIQARLLSTEEIEELFPSLGPGILSAEPKRGETWELRFSTPQSQEFEIRATTKISVSRPVSAYTPPIPLAYFPLASSQKAEIVIESPQESFYQIVNRRLASIPIAAPDWNRYQTIRAAFRYDPSEEAILSAEPPLLIAPAEPQDVPAAAWAWALRLDSQFEAEGTVHNTARFLIENRGKDALKITLPEGVQWENVLAVRVDDVNTRWTENMGTIERPNILGVILPQGKRFVSVSLEYSFKDKPLTHQRKLFPRYPSIDIPVLSDSWTSWFPPEYNVCPRERRDDSEFSFVPYTLNDLFVAGSFNPFSREEWNLILTKRQRRDQAVAASRIFLIRLGRKLAEFETKEEPASASNTAESPADRSVNSVTERKTPTWGMLLNDERNLAESLTSEPGEEFQILRRNGRGPVRTTVKIDRRAVAAIDVFPSTTVFRSNSANAEIRGTDAFERAGLILYVCPWRNQNGEFEVTFYVTSVLSAAINAIPHTEQLDGCVRFLPFAPPEGKTEHSALGETLSPLPQTGPPRWSHLEQWITGTAASHSPWSISPQIIRLAAVTPDWNAFEISHDEFVTPLYVVRRNTQVTYYWLAFLAVIALTWRRPFSSPTLLFLLLVVFEIVARTIAPCFRGIPSGAFLGTLVSFGFVLVRTQVSAKRERRLRERSVAPQGSTAQTLRESPSDAQAFEINATLFPLEDSKLSGEDRPKENSSSENGEPRRSSTSGFLLLGVFLLALTVFFKGIARAESPLMTERESEEKTPLQERVEPYRVFFPIDGQKRIIGDKVWLTDDFLRLLKRQLQVVKPRSLQLWKIDKAAYQGLLAYDPLTQSLDLASLKAVYDISLDTENATIRFPNLPIPPDGAKWDRTPIQPSGQVDDLMVFSVHNQEKGKHRLELTLTPPSTRRDNTRRVSLDIPKVPNAVLRLTVPPDAPPIAVYDCCGMVTPHSIAMSTMTAEIGPSEKLTFSWLDEPGRGDRVAVEVDQLFKLRARSGPVDAVILQAVFRYRIDGGKIPHILLQTDPRWQLSGQFTCAEAPIELAEPFYDSIGSGESAAPQREITRLVFKTPVSGILTIEGAFVLKDFSGIGRVQLPQISASQVKIAKSMLAVSADASMDPGLPDTPKAIGFESTLAEIMASSRYAPTGAKSTNGTATLEDRPLATYDLTKTDPSWSMTIRAKKRLPSIRLNHTVLFDYDEAAFNVSATISANGELFQQTFLAPEILEIEAIDVGDTQGNIAEVRWVKSKQIRIVDELKFKEYTLFFKRALPGEYSLAISGRFPTEIVTQEGSQRRDARIPLILFEDVLYKEQSLNLFRSRSVIVDKPVVAGCQPEETQLEPPTEFVDAVFLDAWKSTTDPTVTGKWEIAEQLNFSRRLPTWTIVPNTPVVRGCQITSMLPSRSGEGWEMAMDLDCEIFGGELETIGLPWNDPCGSPTLIEPTIPWSLERKQGYAQLILLPKHPLSGKQRFRIQAPCNFAGNLISFPNVPIDLKGEGQAEITSYVVLPMEGNQETIVWDWKMLTPLDEATKKEITAKVDAQWEDKVDDGKKKETLNAPQTIPRMFFQVTGENATASITSQNDRPQATLLDIGLLIKADGRIYGTATIDIQSRGHDGFVLQLPNRFEVVQAVCAGVASKGTQLAERRWKINLWGGDYPQRIVIIFKGGVFTEMQDGVETSFNRFGDAGSVMNLQMPYLEGVEVRETLWTLSFETMGKEPLPRMSMTAVRESVEKEFHEDIDDLGICRPISGVAATATQVRLNLARLNNLLAVLELVPTSLSGKTSEVDRWGTHWIREWWSLKKMIGFQLEELVDSAESNDAAPILGTPEASKQTLKTAIKSMSVPKRSFDAMQILEERALTRLGLTRIRQESEFAFPLPTHSLVLWGESLTGHTTHLFGLTEGQLKELRLEPLPEPYRFMQRFQFGWWFWAIPLAVALIVFWHPGTWEIFRRFPHFGGLTLGTAIWILHPSGPFGVAVILLTLFSLVRSPWKPKNVLRREEA